MKKKRRGRPRVSNSFLSRLRALLDQESQYVRMPIERSNYARHAASTMGGGSLVVRIAPSRKSVIITRREPEK